VFVCRDSVNSGTTWLGVRKKSDMMVLLEREDGKYMAGETVRGRVHIILTQDISIKGSCVRQCGLNITNYRIDDDDDDDDCKYSLSVCLSVCLSVSLSLFLERVTKT